MKDRKLSGELREVWDTLNRATQIDALGSLCSALAAVDGPNDVAKLAIGFDTSALLRLGLGTRGTDIIDYLRSKHSGPLIVPGQTIQEVWNGQTAVSSDARDLRRHLSDARAKLNELDVDLGDEGRLVNSSIEALMDAHGEELEGGFQRELVQTLEMLQERATVPYVPRHHFYRLAAVRQSTRCPPGFHDKGDGDFFVWADFLYGLRKAPSDDFDWVVFVCEDKKSDWSTATAAHPVLAGEVAALIDKPLRIWDLAALARFVRCAPA